MSATLAPRGPCALCGCPDARHREVDAVVDRVLAGDPIAEVAEDYDWTVPMVRAAAIAVISDRYRRARSRTLAAWQWQRLMEDQ